MSYQAVREVLNCPRVKGAPRMALVVLAEHANDKGLCWPSVATIARETCVSVRQAKHHSRAGGAGIPPDRVWRRLAPPQ